MVHEVFFNLNQPTQPGILPFPDFIKVAHVTFCRPFIVVNTQPNPSPSDRHKATVSLRRILMSGSRRAKNIDSDGLLNASSTIHSLPNEILCEIFLEYLPDRGYQILVGTFGDTPITLSHVCSRWRKVVLDAPRLWSQLSLDLNEENWQEKHSWDQVIQFVFDWFSKAKDCSLKLRFGYLPKLVGGRRIVEEGYFDCFLTPLMERIQDLELDIFRLPQHLSEVPYNMLLQLESIVLHRGYLNHSNAEMTWCSNDGPLAIFQNALRLRRIFMFFPLFGDSLDSVLIPWFQLTHLIIFFHIIPTIWEELLRQCINLTHGVFYLDADYPLAPSGRKTILAHLVELTILRDASIQSGVAPALLRNFHLPKLQTLRLGPLYRHLEELSLQDKMYLVPHLSLIRRISFQSYLEWRPVQSDHSFAIELLKLAENVEEFDISSTEDYSSIIMGLIISDGTDIILPKLKSISIHFESLTNLRQLQNFSVATLGKMVDSRWHPQRAPTRLRKIHIFLTQSDVLGALVGNLKKSLEDELEGFVSEGLILEVSISGVGEIHWRDRLSHDENYWKEGMESIQES